MSKGSTCLDDPEDWQRLIIDIQLLIFYNLRAFFVIFFFYFLFFFFFFQVYHHQLRLAFLHSESKFRLDSQ